MIKILDVYNDICRLYALLHLGTTNNDVDSVINKFRNINRTNQHPDALQLTNNLKDIMPDADPIYLDLVGEMYAFNHNSLSEYLEEITTKKKNYPKLQEYNVKVQISKTINSLTMNFQVDEFLRMCPDPDKYFKTVKINSRASHYNESMSYLCNRLVLLYITILSKLLIRNIFFIRFSRLHMAYLRSSLQAHNFNLTNTVEALEADPNQKKLKQKRKSTSNFEKNFKSTDNLEFLKEVSKNNT